MSNELILLIIAGILLLLIVIYKLPVRTCPKCKSEAHEVVHTFHSKNPKDSQEMHYYECKECDLSWGHKIARKKNKSPQ